MTDQSTFSNLIGTIHSICMRCNIHLVLINSLKCHLIFQGKKYAFEIFFTGFVPAEQEGEKNDSSS